MSYFKLKTISSLLLASSALFAGSASAAALSGIQTATMNWQGMASATYGDANTYDNIATVPVETTPGANAGGCPDDACFAQNGIVAGVVGDPSDSQAHLHRAGPTANREAQYHPDSSGIYFRMDDLSSFSLQSIYVNVTNSPETGGNFVLYGYSNALNPGLLTLDGAVDLDSPIGTGPGTGGYGSSSDPEGGNTPFIASYLVPNDGAFNRTITFAELVALDADWGNIGAFWLTYKGFNHSPTENYTQPDVGIAYPNTFADFDVRVDDIVLGAAVSQVPVPGALWLFGTGLLALVGRGRKAAA